MTLRWRYWTGRALLTALGWKEEGADPDVPKVVLIAAPHTSNWDLPITLAVGWVMDLDPCWVGKESLFRGRRGRFFRWLGGVPVDRHSSRDQVSQLADFIRSRERVRLVIAPEGTRTRTTYWKTGFYWIAREAEVPIALGYLDYGRKRGGIGPLIQPSGDPDADLASIAAFYRTVTPKRPEYFGEITFRKSGAREERPPKRGRLLGVLHGMGWRRVATGLERLGLT